MNGTFPIEAPMQAWLSAAPAATTGGTAETVLFWVVAPIMVLGALGLVLSRKAVHGAMSLAVVMVGLAVLYIAQEAPFLGVAQIVVYTGAIMMVFLFVVMIVGVDATDSKVETIRGHRVATALVVVALAALLLSVTGRVSLGDPAGMAGAAPEGNVEALADAFFGRFVVTFEVVAALLITAAISAMALTHTETIRRRKTQRELSEERFRTGDPGLASGLPVPGVYARHNSVSTPALLPDGTPSDLSVSRVIVARGAVKSSEELADDVTDVEAQVGRVTGTDFASQTDPDAARGEGTLPGDRGPRPDESTPAEPDEKDGEI